jgi:probable rRNA maturation factor
LTALQLSITGPSAARYAKELTRQLRRAHRILSPPLRRLSLAIVKDETMSSLHHKFLKKNSPTDVLTFELDHNPAGAITEGEVIVCIDEARRRAAPGVPLENELLLYALHGMLHLCGFDDRTKSDFEAMHKTEDAILTDLGIGPIFDPAARRTPRRVSGVR